MKNHFYMSYAGNKRNEAKLLYENINFENIKTVVEPFCGSCAMSYFISLQKKGIKYILNDNNIYLKNMFDILKDEEKINKFEYDYKIAMTNINDKEDYDKFLRDKTKDEVLRWFIKNKIYCIRPGLYPLATDKRKFKKIENLKQYPIYDFFKNNDIEFLNIDGLECYKKYKDDKTNLILLDPPYLDSYNDFYEKSNTNIYEYLHNNNIIKENAHIILILEKIWIIELLFKNNNILSIYDKTYQTKKKKTQHIIIDNKQKN